MRQEDHKDHFLAQIYDDIVSSQGKTKHPVFKSLPKLSVQDPLGVEENDKSKSREKGVLYWKDWFLEDSSHHFITSIL